MYDLSIVMPGIRTQNWNRLYDSINPSIGDYSCELIICGPYPPNDSYLAPKFNYKFIKDMGAPARCTQMASLLAQGEYLMWASDDGVFLPNALKECLDLIKTKTYMDAIIVRYTEGRGMSGVLQDDSYWTARTHADQRIPGVKDSYRIAPVGMYNSSVFRTLGGLDCRFEHINMCTHDLAFRLQNAGGQFYVSPSEVLKCDWNPGVGDHIPVQAAYDNNDKALFQSLWNQDQSDRINIDYFNWIRSPAKWERRFGK